MRLAPTVGWLTLSLAACAAIDLTGDAASNLGEPGLDQRVSLSTAFPAVGDSIRVRSVVVNHGTSPARIAMRCGGRLGFSGLSFDQRPDTLPRADCFFDGPLPAGDSLVAESYTPPIAGSAGDYTLEVRQVTSPGIGVRLRVRVGPARPGTQ